MAETTIEWTATRLPDGTALPGYTFNAWEGCEKISPAWARSLRDQCAERVPFLFKQWGEWAPDCLCGGEKACRETPRPTPGPVGVMFRCGKSAAGRRLDGRMHDAFPEMSR